MLAKQIKLTNVRQKFNAGEYKLSGIADQMTLY